MICCPILPVWSLGPFKVHFCVTYVTHETYLDQLIVFALTKPLSISRHTPLTKPIWIGCLFCLSQNLSASADNSLNLFGSADFWKLTNLSASADMSLTKPIWIGCLFCLSQNLSASADMSLTKIYLDRLFVLSFTKPLRISQHMSLTKPIWIS